MYSGFVSEASNGKSSLDSYSDIDFTQLEMDPDLVNAVGEPDKEAASDCNLKDRETHVRSAIERDPIYFCENVVLMAEDRVFCVPKGGLMQHGTYFSDRIRGDSGLCPLGSSEKDPIFLEGVSKIDFHNFLRLIYPFYGVDVPSGDEHWLGILDLATKWGFREVRETALVRLDHIFTSTSHLRDPIRALQLCKKYDIQKHVNQQIETIITSIKPLDRSALLAGGIDSDTVLLLTDLRDRWASGMLWGGKSIGNGNCDIFPRRLSARKIVEDHFAGVRPGPMSQEGKDAETSCILDEAKRLDNEVRRMEEAEVAENAARDAAESERVAREEEAKEKENLPVDLVEPPLAKDALDNVYLALNNIGDELPAEPGEQIEQLILLHGDKYRVAKQIQELREKGVDRENFGLRMLTRLAERYQEKLKKYWEKATGLQDFSTDVVLENQICVKQASTYDKKASRLNQMIEQAIQKRLGPSANSLSLDISLTRKGSLSRLQTVITAAHDHYALASYTQHRISKSSKIRDTFQTVISEDEFGNWLEAFRGYRNDRLSSAAHGEGPQPELS